MPMERIRVGISSDKASHTTTPGPIENEAMNRHRHSVISHPVSSVGTGPNVARLIVSGPGAAGFGLIRSTGSGSLPRTVSTWSPPLPWP